MMKKIFPGFFTVFAALIFCCCSKKLYTHQQVMQSFHTKDDIFKRFGNPDIKRMTDSAEIWIYNHDISGKNPQTRAETSPFNDTTKITAATTEHVYIKFMFDRTGNIVGYKSKGVDLSYVKKVSTGTNILNTLGIIVLVAVLVGVDAYTNGDISF